MNQFHYLPEDVKNILIGYTGKPKRWNKITMDSIIRIIKKNERNINKPVQQWCRGDIHVSFGNISYEEFEIKYNTRIGFNQVLYQLTNKRIKYYRDCIFHYDSYVKYHYSRTSLLFTYMCK